MSLILIGVNHKTAPVAVREQLSISEAEVEGILSAICATVGVRGAAMLSTCNRVEMVISADHDDMVDPLVEFLTERASLSRAEVEQHLYVLRHGDVVRHLFRVASGLDSMIIGEPQIGGQMRAAYLKAHELKSLDPTLQKLYETTLHVAKKVRTETGIGEHAISVPFAGVELARKIFGSLEGLNVLLLGAGEIGELTAQYLHDNGLKKVLVANRSFERAEELARRYSGEAVPFESFREKLPTCDIVIASTSSTSWVVKAEQIHAALDSRKRKDIFLIDLSVPRNIDPSIAEIDGAYLYNIDDLQEVADSNRERRLEKAQSAEEVIEREVEIFLRRLLSLDVVPTIVELQERLETMRTAELEKCLRKLGPITAEQRTVIEGLSRGIINKVLHYPILRLKESAADTDSSGDTIRQTILKIFGLR